MAKLSVLIPSRNEKFLTRTVKDCFFNARGEIEVVVCLDGYWPDDWKQMTDLYPNLHTVHHGEPRGMRAGINAAAASAISRGAKWLMKADAHVMFDEGFDVKLLETIEPNWIVVPRRKRLDADNWTLQDVGKPDIDYHYLSFPNDPDDWGGRGLNGKVWEQRAKDRTQYEVDDEMSSQGSAWLCAASYFQKLELMDEVHYGPFWNEAQEIFNKAWLSGGRCVVNKRTWYAHLRKGKEYQGTDGKKGRGYSLPESWLQKGRNHTLNWIYNEAWPKQTLPFSWLIEHFWPVPSWPENWEEVLYAERKPRVIVPMAVERIDLSRSRPETMTWTPAEGLSDKAISLGRDALLKAGLLRTMGLTIHKAHYGIGGLDDIDVRERLQNLAYLNNDSLDIIVNNPILTPGENPFRGKKKQLNITYSIDSGEVVTRTVAEKDWLIIGPVRSREDATGHLTTEKVEAGLRQGILEPELIQTNEGLREVAVYVDDPDTVGSAVPLVNPPQTPAALNDFLIRKFQISDRRLRGPMPIELRDFHRNDLAQLFAELGFKKGAEIGVAEGHYSEILLKANPDLELLLVDPWRRYDGNPWAHSQEHQDFSLNETKRKTAPYPNVRIVQDYSMNAVREVEENSLDMVYIDGHHGFDWVMEDLIAWGRRVRSGGIISGDDYYHFKRHWAGVVEAVNAYTQAHRVSPWFLIDAPRSVDFFWVKA